MIFTKDFNTYDSWKLDNDEENIIEEVKVIEENTTCVLCDSDNAYVTEIDGEKYTNCYECKTIYDNESKSDNCPICDAKAVYTGHEGYNAICTKCKHEWNDDEVRT